jgi:hypothetical protein
MILSKRSVPSSANPKKLIRLQRTQQFKNAVELANADVYDIAFNSNALTAINKDDSSCLYIAYKAEEILNAASSKGIAKDVETQSIRHCIGLSLRGKTLCILNHSNPALLANPLKVTVSLKLELKVRFYIYQSLMQS